MRSKPILNGWRRIGIVLVLLWISYVGFLVSTNDHVRQHPFVARLVIVKKSFMTVVPSDQRNEERERYLGRALKPWERSWNDLAMTEHQVEVRVLSADRVIGLMVIPPAITWLIVECLVLIARWIAAGFRRTQE